MAVVHIAHESARTPQLLPGCGERPTRTVGVMSETDHDHLDDGVDMSFEERRQDTLRRMSGSDAHDAAPRVEVSRAEDGDVRIDVADSAAVRPGDPDGTDPRTDEAQGH